MTKIQSFTDLIAWKEGHKLVLNLYKITSQFPNRESYALTDQMRRAAISITSNIAEGFPRRTEKEKVQFFYISIGSTTELQNQLLIARDLDYIRKEDFTLLANQTILIHKLIIGLIKNLRKT